MITYQENRKWSDRFIGELADIASELLRAPLGIAPTRDDCDRNTDLIELVNTGGGEVLRIGCRVRRFKYLKRYPFDITFRSRAHNGGETEYGKMMHGWGTHFLYSFADAGGCRIIAYRLIDLEALRDWMHMQRTIHGSFEAKANGDGTEFVTVDVRTLPPGVQIDKWYGL